MQQAAYWACVSALVSHLPQIARPSVRSRVLPNIVIGAGFDQAAAAVTDRTIRRFRGNHKAFAYLPEERHEHDADLTSMSKVLVIDGDLAVRTAVETALRHHGYDVTGADDGRSGFAAAEGSPFDLIIVDIFMPGMDGLASIRRFNESAPSVPVIALSGFSFRNSTGRAPDFLAMATKLGATATLQKPFGAQDLLAVVEACLTQVPSQPLVIPPAETIAPATDSPLPGDIALPAHLIPLEASVPADPATLLAELSPLPPPLASSEPTEPAPASTGIPPEVAPLARPELAEAVRAGTVHDAAGPALAPAPPETAVPASPPASDQAGLPQ